MGATQKRHMSFAVSATFRPPIARSVGEVAARLGLSQNRISHLEQHPDELSFKQLLGWCAALGLELRLGVRGDNESAPKAEW